MSARVLDIESGQGGGAIELLADIGRPRTILITVVNIDPVAANNHAAFFARSRRELVTTPTGVIAGFAVPVQGNTAPTAGVPQNPGLGFVGGKWYSSIVVEGWQGALWAQADAAGVVQVDVQDMGGSEK